MLTVQLRSGDLPPAAARAQELDSWVSREAAFLVNNWILLFSAFFVLFATMFPTLSEAIVAERLTVGPPFFNKWMLRLGSCLPADRDRAAARLAQGFDFANVARQFAWPVAAMLVTGRVYALVSAFGSRSRASRSARLWSRTIAQEFVVGARCGRGSGTDIFTALVGLVARSHRRYGGYIVHLGIRVMFLGFAGRVSEAGRRSSCSDKVSRRASESSRSGTTP